MQSVDLKRWMGGHCRSAPAALLFLLGVVAIVGVQGAGAAGGISSACVKAGLQRPTFIHGTFEITNGGPEHNDVTFPGINFRYRIPALPASCEGKVIQLDEAKVKYKVSKLPERTLTVRQFKPSGHEAKVHWMNLYRGKSGTGLPGETIPASGFLVIEECFDDGYPEPFGAVERVTGLERLSVKEVGSGKLLGTKTRALPITFKKTRQNWTQARGACSPGQLSPTN